MPATESHHEEAQPPFRFGEEMDREVAERADAARERMRRDAEPEQHARRSVPLAVEGDHKEEEKEGRPEERELKGEHAIDIKRVEQEKQHHPRIAHHGPGETGGDGRADGGNHHQERDAPGMEERPEQRTEQPRHEPIGKGHGLPVIEHADGARDAVATPQAVLDEPDVRVDAHGVIA